MTLCQKPAAGCHSGAGLSVECRFEAEGPLFSLFKTGGLAPLARSLSLFLKCLLFLFRLVSSSTSILHSGPQTQERGYRWLGSESGEAEGPAALKAVTCHTSHPYRAAAPFPPECQAARHQEHLLRAAPSVVRAPQTEQSGFRRDNLPASAPHLAAPGAGRLLQHLFLALPKPPVRDSGTPG